MRSGQANLPFSRRLPGAFALSLLLIGLTSLARDVMPQAVPALAKAVGTVQTIAGRSLTVISDTGVSSAVSVDEATTCVRIEPGQTDLKEATPIAFSDLQVGDRVLVRGPLNEDGKSIRATSIVAVKKSAVSEKQSRERAEWQSGVGGLVKAIDRSALTISVTTNGFSGSKQVLIHFTKDTVFRRYAPDSTRFDVSRISPSSDIQPGDQLRARGSRAENGAEFSATEVVSGTFRSIAATVISSDEAKGTLLVQDLASKSPLTLQVSGESQMRKLPAPFAENLAARLRQGAAAAPALPGVQPAAVGSTRSGDFQQLIARMPAARLSDLQKGEAVMIVATQGGEKALPTVITLLAGVEPILRASPNGGQDMILSPWSLGGGEPSGG
jgi:uncharacterized protein DUF5666